MPTSGSAKALRAARRLESLCSVVPDRRPGSVGNDEAVALVAKAMEESGWNVEFQEFDCLDWDTDGGELTIGGDSIDITPSPYGLGVKATGPVRVLRTLQDLEQAELAGSVAVLAGELASEPLTPKAFPFYGSDEHAEIIRLLEAGAPAAVIGVTGKYPELCGALDPFPLIEDGDFEIPAASVRPDDAKSLLDGEGLVATVELRSRRIPSRARNVVATRGPQSPRVTVIAHIDTKPGTPGAVDNATGVVVLLLLAELLNEMRHPDLPVGVELLAVNGEDHYAAPGELAWLGHHGDALDDIPLVINIDGAGYRSGRSAYSTYNIEGSLAGHVEGVFESRDDFMRGPEWFQSDHAIFAMRGRPALAITTEHVQEMLGELFHSAADTPDQVDIDLVVGIASAIEELVATWSV
ncbi:MAG: M28 family peptidase [Acidimicrobiia bacterium]